LYRRNAPLRLLAVAIALAVLASPAAAIKVCTYNILNFPDDYLDRVDAFRLVMDEIDADVIVVQEIDTWQSANLFQDDILNYYEEDEYTRMPFINGPDTDNACFYKPDVLDAVDDGYLDTGVRYTNWYEFRPVGYSSSEASFVLFSTHLKAGSSSSDQSERLAQTTIIRDYCNDYPSGSNFMVAGDFNIQSSGEGSYQMLVGFQVDNDGRCKDPIATGGTWHDNYSLRETFTQSPRVDGGSGTGGGMDDRFDFILISYELDSGDGLDYVDYSYTAYGNDGLRFNNDINNPTNQIVSAALADALYDASDHLPVFLELQVPARVSAPDTLDFGEVIVGRGADEMLSVDNVAGTPGEDLDYSLSAPAGFSAPGGSFSAAAGEGNDHTVTMDTATTGVKSGDLTISSNDLDYPSLDVALSGTVLDHASPSLAELSALLSDTLDFGAHDAGEFVDQSLFVYNQGYGSLQALLEVYDATITGSDRFSFVGGFGAETVGGTPAEYVLAFDAAGSPSNTGYTAELTFSTRDDTSVAGGTDLDDLVVQLEAFVEDGTSVPGGDVLALALGPGAPNPFTERTSLRLALPAASHASVEIYDVKGRLVTTLVDGIMPAGENWVAWDGTDGGEKAATGIYFCRAQVGDWAEARKLVLLR